MFLSPTISTINCDGYRVIHASPSNSNDAIVLRPLGLTDYSPVWQAMQDFTLARSNTSQDQIWLTEHHPVFTLGQAGKPEHILHDIGISCIASDRGGQVTYHGPGQAVIYVLLDLDRLKLKIRELVFLLEQIVIDWLADHAIQANRRAHAPGVYIADAKIAALGLRVKRSCCYHGLAVNVDMDLAPFSAINPCGYPGLAVTQLVDQGIKTSVWQLQNELAEHLCRHLHRPLL